MRKRIKTTKRTAAWNRKIGEGVKRAFAAKKRAMKRSRRK